MSEYRRFVSYIYEYRRGEKERNCGYVKGDIRNGACRLLIHLHASGSGTLRVYGFLRENGGIRGILLGNAEGKNQVYDFSFAGPAASFADTRYSLDDIRGIWLKGAEEENYITVWDDEPVSVERFTEKEAEDRQTEEAQPQEGQMEETNGAASKDALQETAAGDMIPTETKEAQPGPGSLWERWENFLNHYPAIEPFADSEIMQCLCIAPKDLSFLPREEWQYSRNTFVRQAYARYHHLILGKHESGRFVLAVPGSGDPQEKHMAVMCGFPYLKEAVLQQAQDSEVHAADLSGPACYWYHFLNERFPK